MDLALAAQWRGSGTTAKIDRATFTVGPFSGTAQGTVQGRYPDFRLDLSFESAAVPCERFGRQAAGGLLDLLNSAAGKTVSVSNEVAANGSGVISHFHSPAIGKVTSTR